MCLLSSRLKHYLEIFFFLTIRKMSLSKQHANLPVRGQEINKNLALSFPWLSSCRVLCRLSQSRRASWRVICSVVQSRWGFCFWSHWECQTFCLSFVEQIHYFPLFIFRLLRLKVSCIPFKSSSKNKIKTAISKELAKKRRLSWNYRFVPCNMFH